MTSTKKWKAPTAALATAALTMGLLTIGSTSALAATVCNTDLGSDTVVGDLTVPAGADCTLGGAHIQGNVTVEPGGWLDATSTTIDGSLTATDAYGITLDGDTVGGDIVIASVVGGFAYLNDLTVNGNVDIIGADTEISDSTLHGNLTVTDADYADLLRTTVNGDATISGATYGVNAHGNVITGSLSVTDSARGILIGATDDGTADTYGNTIGGDLTVTGNGNDGLHDNLQIAGTSVLGTITLADNTPAANFGPGVSAAAVDGDSTGETPTIAAPGDGESQVVVQVPDRDPGEFIWTIDSSASLVNLGVAVENGDHFAASGTLSGITVTDTRITQDAWTVSGQLSDFTNGADTASGKYLGWTPFVSADTDNTVGAVAGTPVESGFVNGDGLSVSRELASAPAGHPTGSANLGADLDLQLPVAVATGTWNATLTLTALS